MIKEDFAVVKKILKYLDLDESKYPWFEIEKLPVFGSSTNRPDGSFKYEIKEKNNNFSSKSRSSEWSKILKCRFDRQCGELQKYFGYDVNVYPEGIYCNMIAKYYADIRKLQRLIKSVIMLKKGFRRVYAETIKAR